MEVEDILSYVTNTPGNTNPNVLKPMLNELKGSGGGGSSIIKVGVTITEGDDGTTYTLDKTYSEIVSADYALLLYEEDGFVSVIPLTGYGGNDVYSVYAVQFLPDPYNVEMYSCSSANDYPSYTTEK